MNFEVIIGIEIHCELLTKTKMFSSSKKGFNDQVNTNVNAVDLGMPGIIPSLNKRGVMQALKACHIFNADINQILTFDRKCYFYPDLTKGYQITQDERPIGTRGYVDLKMNDYTKRIIIDKIIIEEDTAKLVHTKDATLIDYNRAGNPLIEIISDASMRNAKEASTYVATLRKMLLYAGISDAKMEEGSLRCDVNISLRPHGQKDYGTKVEVKNLNSLANIEKAVEFEINRQRKILMANEELESETRRFDEDSKTTVLMRKKDGFIDYRFHTEPNIFPTAIDDRLIAEAKQEIPKMPDELIDEYTNQYGISLTDAKILTSDIKISDYFNEAIMSTTNYKTVANWILMDIMSYMNKHNVDINEQPLKPPALALMINRLDEGLISSKQLKEIYEIVARDHNNDIDQIIKDNNMAMISDPKQILKFINEVLADNQASIDDYKAGKERATKFLLGQIMKKSKGQVNPQLTNELLLKELKKK